MADNVTYGTSAATPPSGTVISTEEVTTLNGGAVSAQQVQRVLPTIRTADATAVDLPGDATYGLDVDVTRVTGTVDVGGNSKILTPTITVSTAQYSAGDSIGGKVEIANALRSAGRNVVLQNIHILDRANQKPTGNILIFNADPSVATITDNAAFVYSTDDLKEIARIPIATSDYVTINSKAIGSLPNLGRVLEPVSGTSLYYAFVTDGTPTFTATTDLQISFGLLRD